MEQEFKGKVALVTGAAAGIGRASALALARKGAVVVVSDIMADEGKETTRMIESSGGSAAFIKADMSDSAEIRALFMETAARYGRLDLAVNNAGIEGDIAFTVECPEENWDRVISINLKGVWLCMKAEIQQMLKQGGGCIVNVASVAGLLGFPGIGAYVAAKHGVNGMTKVAAIEYGRARIRVNSICPGFIHTGMIDRILVNNPEFEAAALSSPHGRMGRPEEIAETAVWLCSEAASFVNGHTMVVDGGYSIV